MIVAETPIRMPKLSMTMEEGEFGSWLVAAGDTVTKGMPVAVVMTDKVEMEIESEVAGTVKRLTAQEGDVVPVGDPLGYVDGTDDSSDDGGLGDLDDLLS
jgi:pyruvate/2-oxoglutarate dehydrogenase complex dihydrolipoamide acyltransferase (E2) component